MNLTEYARYDALGLAELVARKEVTARELAQTAMAAIAAINPLNAVVETYADRIDALDEATLGDGPFRGVPFLMKDVFGHEAGRRIEFGSRLCRDMVVQQDTHYCQLVRAAGLNIIGRSAAPEYSMSGTTETRAVRQHLDAVAPRLLGRRFDRRRHGRGDGRHRAGGARLGHRRVDPHPGELLRRRRPQALARPRVLRPDARRERLRPGAELRADEDGARRRGAARLPGGAATRRPVRDPAAGAALVGGRTPAGAAAARRLLDPAADGLPGGRRSGERGEPTAHLLADMGHDVEEDDVVFDGLAAMRSMMDVWFFGFDLRLAGYSQRSGHAIGRDTLEPVIHMVYEYARAMKPSQFLGAMAALNTARRQLGASLPAPRHLADADDAAPSPSPGELQPRPRRRGLRGAGGEGVPAGVPVHAGAQHHGHPGDLAAAGPALERPADRRPARAPPANEHLLLQLATALEEASPGWTGAAAARGEIASLVFCARPELAAEQPPIGRKAAQWVQSSPNGSAPLRHDATPVRPEVRRHGKPDTCCDPLRSAGGAG